MRETIGLLGGSFNPVHLGHLAMAEAAKRELGLTRLLIIPDGDPPHKSTELAGKHHRLRMTELAAAGRFEVSAMEVERPGKTYTVDTLEVLAALYPDAQLYMIIGADTLREISGWRNAARVFELCTFAVFGRDDLPLEDVPGAKWAQLKTEIPDISATEIRARVHAGLSLEGYTPRVVEDYIGLHRLYQPPVELGEKAMRKQLREMLPPARYKHTLGVEKTIRSLAVKWGYNEHKSMLAGLLHDCSKGLSLEDMRRYVDANGIQVDQERRVSVALLHAAASAAMARAEFGVTDPEILEAIRYHNTGRVPMGMLDKLLYMADMTEPGRHMPWVEALRRMSVEDLDGAVLEGMRIKLEYLINRGRNAHPDTVAARAAMQTSIKREGTA